MARSDTLTIPPQTWTQLTNADAAAVRVQHNGGPDVYLQGTVGATPPSALAGAVVLRFTDTITADQTLAGLFPQPSGVNRLYAWSEGTATVSVSHADA
jgi:anti-sigma-K factor RskA